MIDMHLDNNLGFAWEKLNNIYFKGIVYIEGCYIGSQELIGLIGKIKSESELLDFLNRIDGNFCLIFSILNETYLVVDKLRSIPLFYTIYDTNVKIYDSINSTLIRKFGINERAVDIFRSSTSVIGEETLVNGIKQIPAGHLLKVSTTNEFELIKYWEFHHKHPIIADQEKALQILEVAYENAFKKTINFLAGRPAVVPLSGGHDSRLVVYLLKKFGHKNIITFSYGDEKSEDSKIARQVATAFGVPFYFIQYTRKNLKSFFDENLHKLMEYCSSAVSITHIQDIYAVYELVKSNVIPKESVIMPGLGGTLPGQSIQPDFYIKENYNLHDLVNRIVRDHFFKAVFFEKDFTKKYELVLDILQKKGVEEKLTNYRVAEILEWFTVFEKQPKYTLNSVRAYEFFGLKWQTPLYSMELFDAWSSIDAGLRLNNRMFRILEKRLIDTDILSIRFTGTKERPTTLGWTGITSKAKTALGTILIPTRTNYLSVSVPLYRYYRNIFFHGRHQIFYYFMAEYLAWMRKIAIDLK